MDIRHASAYPLLVLAIAGVTCTSGDKRPSSASSSQPHSSPLQTHAPPVVGSFSDRIILYYGSRGDIFKRTALPGSHNLTSSHVKEVNPAVAPDGELLFVRASDDGGELVVLSGDPPKECCFRPGLAPAYPFDPRFSGRLSVALRIAARVLRPGMPETHGRAPEIAIGIPTSEAESIFPVRDGHSGRFLHLSFDAGWPKSRYLYYENGRGVVYFRTLRFANHLVYPDGPGERLVKNPGSSAYVAPVSTRPSSVDLLRVRNDASIDLVDVDLQPGNHGRVVPGDTHLLANLNDLDLDVSRPQRLILKYAGCLAVDRGGTHFAIGSKPAWFVTDRKSLYLVDADGNYALIPDVHPSSGIAPVAYPCPGSF